MEADDCTVSSGVITLNKLDGEKVTVELVLVYAAFFVTLSGV